MLDPELFSPCKIRVKVSSGFRGESKFKVELHAGKLVAFPECLSGFASEAAFKQVR